MSATYDPTQPSAKDRVRFMVADKATRFDFEDEEIAAELVQAGFVGDPLATLPRQAAPELDAAISLLESLPGVASSGSGASTTIKTLTTTRTSTDASLGTKDRRAILANLRKRRSSLDPTTAGYGPAVADGYPCGGCW